MEVLTPGENENKASELRENSSVQLSARFLLFEERLLLKTRLFLPFILQD